MVHFKKIYVMSTDNFIVFFYGTFGKIYLPYCLPPMLLPSSMVSLEKYNYSTICRLFQPNYYPFLQQRYKHMRGIFLLRENTTTFFYDTFENI
jgi:hypothetical protein